MVALRTLIPEDRGEIERELEATLRQKAKLSQKVAQLRRDGEPADSPYLRKLQWQIDACVTWIGRYSTALAEQVVA